MPARTPALYGCMDQRLGISDKISNCKTCYKKLTDCAGHFGYIQLELPVFHAGFFKHTLTIMQCICKKCSRVLIPKDDRPAFLKKMRDPRIDALGRAAVFKKVVDTCKRQLNCQYCNYSNGVVKKVGGGCFKIIHEEHRAKGDIADLQRERFRDEIRIVEKDFADLKPHLQKSVKILNPLRVYELLIMIKDEDMSLLWMDSYGRPETLVMWSVPVPPVPIRPSVPQETGGSTEDDITIQLREIIEMNNALKMALDKGATIKMVAEDWEFLQIQVALFINGEIPGIPRQLVGPKAVRGLCQRLKGKQGRFRGNLSGKRVDFSGRTVISPDPNLMVNQVGVPILVAKVMTYPERVNKYNIHKLRQCVRNGADKHPGANIVRTAAPQNTFTLQFANREKVANDLKAGDIVERHMNDGDIVLFNRQPSLHKMSIMAHRVKVMPWRTFRFNECACTPYNADFDGDEMNMHLPQTEEARAEAAILLDITNNLITPRNGEPLVAATQDFLTGAYLMTAKDVFYTRSQVCRLLAYLSDAMEHIDLPKPTIWKPRQLWTGKQVFSLLVRPNKASTSFVNIESEEKFYTRDKHFCPKDGYVAFRNGELLSGNLGKKTLGGESKSGLFYVLIRDYGPAEATRCMGRLAKLSARFIGDRGFSIGVDDVTPSVSMLKLKQRILTEGQRAAEDQIEAYKSGKIRLKPGCDALQSLESEVNGILGKIRENCGKEALGAINYRNSALCMAQCGSKGSPLNISQMIACLGQQSVGGTRIQDGFVNRTLPHFPVGALSPAAKGFVANSFFSGLTATEFFFHTMGGREGLVDTAVKTAETGYMARRLMKALEDLSMQYDQTVRNSEQTVVQFRYGDDGLNPQLMEKGDRPVDYYRILVNVVAKDSLEKGEIKNEGGSGVSLSLSSKEIRELIEAETSKERFVSLLPQGYQFISETKSFFNKLATDVEELEKIGGYNPNERQMKEVENIEELRMRLRKMKTLEKNEWISASRIPGSDAFKEVHSILRNNTVSITKDQVLAVLSAAINKYHLSMIEPGEAVGAVGAQSLSEPGTQMTLKTFHFAGVASMNVTLGVPRLKEIINASKTISTPIITAQLVQSDSLTSARVVKAQIEKTTLGEISLYICDVLSKDQAYISIRLDMDAIHNLHLNLDARSIKDSIINTLPG